VLVNWRQRQKSELQVAGQQVSNGIEQDIRWLTFREEPVRKLKAVRFLHSGRDDAVKGDVLDVALVNDKSCLVAPINSVTRERLDCGRHLPTLTHAGRQFLKLFPRRSFS